MRKDEHAPSVRLCEDVKVVDEADLCVLGGSCTGVFAAIRAARLGARVIIIEKQNHFGGVAPIVCTWHSLADTAFARPIIGGLTAEIIERLRKREAVQAIGCNESKGYEFRPGELKVLLDEMILESRITPYLHTMFTAPVVEDGRLTGVVIENKSGRGIVRAKAFVDATGDGDLCARLGLEQYRYDAMLPPTTAAFLDRWPAQWIDIGGEVSRRGRQHGLEEGFVWGTVLPGTDVFMLAGTRMKHMDCCDARDLTAAEIEGRRQVRAIMDMLRAAGADQGAVLLDFPASIGIRDTRHIRCQYQLTGEDVLEGKRFPDAIANGSYRVDTHYQDRPGIIFKYLDGRTEYHRPGYATEIGRWREPRPVDPTFYQVPLRSLIPAGCDNLILAGRMLDADQVAFSAVRVMVNTNQLGEAAGVAAYLAMSKGVPLAALDAQDVRKPLAAGGSIVI